MSDFAVFGPTYLFVDVKLEQFLGQGVSHALAVVESPLRLALVLYVMLYGFAILRGAISEPIMDFAIRSIKLVIIYRLATTAAYGDYVTQPLFHLLPETIARAVAGSSVSDPGAAFDQFLARVGYLAEKISDQASLSDPGPWLMAVVVMVVGALAAALGFGVVLLAKVALALIICLGPLFIACALFEATRRYFFGWLSQAVNYIVLFGLVIAIFQLVLSLVDSRWGSIEALDPMSAGLLFVSLSLLGAIFFLQTPVIAAGIAGGAAVGLSDFLPSPNLSRSGAPTYGLANPAPPAASGGAISPARP